MATLFGHGTSGTTIAQFLSKEITGKTIVLTGPTTGTLGGETAMSLVLHHPKHLVLVGRSESKTLFVENEAKKLSHNTKVTFVSCELGDQESVRKAASEIVADVDKIDVLFNNAGIMATPYSATPQGIESQFGTNHVGHFLLTNLLLPKMASGGRIINVTSMAYEMSQGFDFNDYNFSEGQTYDPWKAYAQSKTANILFTSELAKRLKHKSIAAFSVHPGVITDSNLIGKAAQGNLDGGSKLWEETHPGEEAYQDPPKTLQQGCATSIMAAFDPNLADKSGAFLKDCQINQTKPWASDPETADKLWALSEKLVGVTFDV